MIFFRVFPRTRCEQNKLSYWRFWQLFCQLRHFWWGTLFASFSSSSFGKKTTNSQFQGFKTIRISGQVPDDGSHWDDAFAESWMTGYLIGWWLMVDGWDFFLQWKKKWFQVFLRHFPFSTCLCTICTCIPKVNHWGFCWIEGIPGSFEIRIWRLVKPWTLPRVGVYRAISMIIKCRYNVITSYSKSIWVAWFFSRNLQIIHLLLGHETCGKFYLQGKV